jgi:hypothetical protein
MSDEIESAPQAPEPVPIPEVLHSFYEDRPFRTCTRCGESLIHFEEGFRISKNFRLGETILEYAMCMPCLTRMIDEMSEESKQRHAEYQAKHYRGVSGFDECALCEETRVGVRDGEYGLIGVCQGEHMSDSAMICVHCMETMAELMSEQSRRTWERFREENFPGVPCDLEPFPIGHAPSLL